MSEAALAVLLCSAILLALGVFLAARRFADRLEGTFKAAVVALETATSAFQASATLLTKGAVTATQDVMDAALQKHLDEAVLAREVIHTAVESLLKKHLDEAVLARREAYEVMRGMLVETHAMAADLDKRVAESAAHMASQVAVAVEAREVASQAAVRAQKHVEQVQALLEQAQAEADAAVSRARHAADAARAACVEAEAQAQKVRSLPKGFGPAQDAHPGFASKSGSPYDPLA